jgi:hypothetical protein
MEDNDAFVLSYTHDWKSIDSYQKLQYQCIADVVILEKSLVVYNDMIELLDKVFNHLSAEEKELLYAS